MILGHFGFRLFYVCLKRAYIFGETKNLTQNELTGHLEDSKNGLGGLIRLPGSEKSDLENAWYFYFGTEEVFFR